MIVKDAVEAKYGPLYTKKLYGFIPEKLYEHKGSTLISFNKFKHYPTFTLKNLFGFLPDPIRCWWHGPKNSRMNKSVVAINKLYSSFFDILGAQESLGSTPVFNKEGKHGEVGFRYDLVDGSKLVGVGKDRVELDILMAGVGGFKLEEAEYLEMANGVLGKYDPALTEQVKDYSV